MDSYVPKYQLSAIMARRSSRAEHAYVTIQRKLKSGKWGKPFTFEKRPEWHMQGGNLVRNGWESDENAFGRFVSMNTTAEYRMA